MAIFNDLDYFNPSEFDYPNEVSRDLLRKLDYARSIAGRPFYITSDYRPSSNTSHGAGLAVDIADNLEGAALGSEWRYWALRGLILAGFKRIGVYDRHIHADLDDSRPTPVIWTDFSD